MEDINMKKISEDENLKKVTKIVEKISKHQLLKKCFKDYQQLLQK